MVTFQKSHWAVWFPTVSAAAKVPGPLGQSVQEALESLLMPELSRQILDKALDLAQLRSFPEDPSRARELVEGPLWAAIAETFGHQTARFVLDDLEPILELATSGVRRKDTFVGETETARPLGAEEPYSASTRRPGARHGSGVLELPEALPHVLVATASDRLPPPLTGGLPSAARVSLVVGAFELFTALEMRTGPVWVLVDGHRPSVDLSTLAAFLGRLPPECWVLLWGWDPQATARFVRERGWSALRSPDDWNALAEELAATMRSAG
jgi:hypothetical protein